MTTRIALVTGGNRGIGYEICRGLAALDGYQVILTARDAGKGQAAVQRLQNKRQNVHFLPLDVDDPASAEALYRTVEKQFGRLDALVNNAAILLDEGSSALRLPAEILGRTLETNLYGPLKLCQLFIPLMQRQQYGRVVNVSSGAGSLHDMSDYAPAYSISKAALNALTRILAAQVYHPNIKINSMCPGWVRTEMGGPGAPRSPERGAETAIWLATLPDNAPSNGFFRDRQPIAW